MNKKILKLIIFILVLIVLYIGFKLVMLKICTVNPGHEYKEIINGLRNQSEISITTNKLLEEEYFIINNSFKIKNFLVGYKKTDNNIYKKEIDGKEYAVHFLSDEEASMILTKGFSSENKDIMFYTDSNTFINLFYLADRNDFLKRNNIKDDIDFYKFVANNYVIKNNLFTSTKEMLQNYAFNYYCYIAIPKISSVTYINGDIKGWIFKTLPNDNNDVVYQVTILKDDKQYGFLTNVPRFKDESFIKEILSSVVIDKENTK